MRKNRHDPGSNGFSILTVDDDPIMTATLQSYFEGSGYRVDIENDPSAAVERVRNGKYDIMLLDFLMTPICGDQVVEQIRKFNQDLFIILLTGHKSMAPPIKTIRDLDIQGYYEKSDRFDQLELLVESCAKSVRQLRLIHSYQDGITALVDSMPDLYRLQNSDDLCSHILKSAADLFQCENGVLVRQDTLEPRGEPQAVTLGQGIGCYAGLSPQQLMDLARDNCDAPSPNVLAAPLSSLDQHLQGMLAIEVSNPPNLYQVQLFRLFVRQSSAALGNANLLSRIRRSYMEMIGAMRRMVDAKDIYTRGHSDRVAYYAGLLAEAMGKDVSYCDRVRTAGLFHDIGKLAIPDEILMSSGRLSDEEFAVIRRHPQKGCDILAEISMFCDIVPIVLHHHERIDGKGYPSGLAGDQIPEEARIITIADSFDAMTSTRRYRPNMTFQQAENQLIQGKGTQFDAAMVDTFLAVLKNWDKIQKDLDTCVKL